MLELRVCLFFDRLQNHCFPELLCCDAHQDLLVFRLVSLHISKRIFHFFRRVEAAVLLLFDKETTFAVILHKNRAVSFHRGRHVGILPIKAFSLIFIQRN